jgi:hypothetical protein
LKFPIFTALSIMLTGLFFFLYITFNYAFHNPESGAFTRLDELRPSTLGNYSGWAADILNFQHNWWGTCFVVLIVMTIVCAFIDVLRNPKQGLD